MFEFIGFVVVAWIIFVIVRGFFRGRSMARSQEFGIEARRIAEIEIKVPSSYFTYQVTTNMDLVKSTADKLQEFDEYKNSSWPRRMALAIYGEYHAECQNWKNGDPYAQDLLLRLKISAEAITEELGRDPQQVLLDAA